MDFIFTMHAAACLYMTGVIWVIQTLHYPAFTLVPDDRFVAFHQRHTRMMTAIAGPFMLVELATGAWLAWAHGGWWWADLAAVGLLFASTFLVSVPLHDRLGSGAHHPTSIRLTRTNWPRTIVWTVRSLVFLCWSFLTYGAEA